MSRSRRIVKRALGYFAATTGVIVLVLPGVVAYAARDREDTFSVRDAEFADVGYLQRLALESEAHSRSRDGDFAVYAHRLKRGSGIVLGLRAYSPGRLGVIDDETYQKITVWIAGPIPADAFEAPLTDGLQARVVITEGGSAWPRSACSRVATAGFLRVERARGRFSVSIRADTAAAGKIPPRDCGAESLDVQFDAKEMHLTISHHGSACRGSIRTTRHTGAFGLTRRCS